MISPKIKNGLNILVVVFVLYLAYRYYVKGTLSERFHTSSAVYSHLPKSNRYWWLPEKGMRTQHPYTTVPWGFEPSEEPHTDMTLTNLYRQLHNVEAIARNDVFNNPTHMHPGGSDGTEKRFFVGEYLDRQRMLIRKKIRDDIAAKRRPWSDAFSSDVPHTALGGNFYDCHVGDCQWNMDYEGKILGIPSVPGIRHTYY